MVVAVNSRCLLSHLTHMHTFPFIAFMKSKNKRGSVLVYCITGGNEEGMVTAGGH